MKITFFEGYKTSFFGCRRDGSLNNPAFLLIYIAVLLFSHTNAFAQKKPATPTFDTIHITPENVVIFKDSILIPQSDTILLIKKGTKYRTRKNPYKKSEAFYDSLYYKSDNNFFGRELYTMLVKYKPQDQEVVSSNHTDASEPFDAYLGKTISSIHYKQVDLMEGSVDDTSRLAVTDIGRFINKTHVNTRPGILKNYTLVKVGDKVNPGILSDNERVIRNLPGIEDVRFLLVPDPDNDDMVKLIIVTQDVFPIAITAQASSITNFQLGFWNSNTLGLNFGFGGQVYFDADEAPVLGYDLGAKYGNIKGSFIDAELTWLDAFVSQRLQLKFSKKFLTPQTKFGGELDVGWIDDVYGIGVEDTVYEWNYTVNYQDVWAGRSFLLGNEQSRKNLIFSLRLRREYFIDRPYVARDSNAVFHDEKYYLGKIAYSNLSYYKSSLIRSYGVTENVPYGMVCSLTFGYTDIEFFGRTYLGGRLALGKYFTDVGYFSGNVILGTFLDGGKPSQGIFETTLFYYTPLMHINLYGARSFFTFRYRRALTNDIKADVNFGDKIRDLDQRNLTGRSLLSLNYEFVLFPSWYIYGFRFAPYVFADMGLISSSVDVFYQSSFYSAFGFGIRLGNESFAFNTINLSMGFLPQGLNDQSAIFYHFDIGQPPLIPGLDVQRPHIYREEVIFPTSL